MRPPYVPLALAVLALAALPLALGACADRPAADAGPAGATADAPAATPVPTTATPDPTPPANPAGRPEAPPSAAKGRVVVLGNSIAAGYGLPSPDLAFPALLQAKVDSAGLPFTVENAGVSGETTAGGLARLDWLLERPVAVLVVELGGNDGLRGIDPASTQQNLAEIVRRTKARYPDARVVLAGMQVPPNLGGAYVERFRAVFGAVAAETGADLIPFVLEGVGGVPRLNQRDRIHPTAEGQRIVAATVWRTLGPILRDTPPAG